MDPLLFWYENLGRYLHPANIEGDDRSKALISLSRNYRNPSGGGDTRMGTGPAMSVVTAQSATLCADILPEQTFPETAQLQPKTWRTQANWLTELILTPPEPPFLIVRHGRSWDSVGNWQISESPDVIHVCGDDRRTIQRPVVLSALEALGDIPVLTWRAGAYLVRDRLRKEKLEEVIDERLELLFSKHPALDGALDLLPPWGSDDYEALSMLCSTIETNKKEQKKQERLLKKAA